MRPLGTRFRFVLLLCGLAALVVAVVAVSRAPDAPRREMPAQYRPVVRPTALDSWRAPWPRDVAAEGGALPARWLVLGWDGASWDIVLPLLEAGRMPNLARLMEQGTYGALLTFRPAQSTAVWSSIATGVSPDRHGILGFEKPRRGAQPAPRELFSNADRRVKALWNLASERGKKVMVVGYHNTYPAEQVSGLMVSNYFIRAEQFSPGHAEDASRDQAFFQHLVYPTDALPAVLKRVRTTKDLKLEDVRPFAAVDAAEFQARMARLRRNPERHKRWGFLCKAYLYDTFHAQVAFDLRSRFDPDLLFLHLQMLDWAGHNFLYYHWPERYALFGFSPEDRARLDADRHVYEGTIAAFYAYADRWLGKLLEARDPGLGVILLSDHGMEPQADADKNGAHNEAPPGIVVLNGPGIRKGHVLLGATVYDVLPTLVASLGFPLARDLDGKVLKDALAPSAFHEDRLASVASYEKGERFAPQIPMADTARKDLEEDLKALGYIK